MKRKLKRLQQPRKGIQYIIYPETRKELSPFVFFDAGTMQRNDDGLFIGMHPQALALLPILKVLICDTMILVNMIALFEMAERNGYEQEVAFGIKKTILKSRHHPPLGH